MADEAPDDTLTGLLCDALDGDDPIRLHLMVALVLTEAPVISQADRDRLHEYGPPPVMRL